MESSEDQMAYTELTSGYASVAALRDAKQYLSWDQQVVMPAEGTPARRDQLAALSAQAHAELTHTQIQEALDQLSSVDLESSQNAVVREVARQYDRAASVPTELVKEMAATEAEALSAWERAREDDDFDIFAPYLQSLLDLKREYANHIDSSRDIYGVLFEEFEPYLGLGRADEILQAIREALVPLLSAIRESSAELRTDALSQGAPYSAAIQEELSQDVLETLGMPPHRTRLDTATHPFSIGTPYDARITTRFDETDPLSGLLSTIHEFGHATYTLGLPEENQGSPLGEHRGLTVHESQSRLWENHVGRSPAFWEALTPIIQSRFSGVEEVTPTAAYEAVNQVYPENLIRVEADELSYHLHIIIRYEIERDLLTGDLDVQEVPAVWNDRYQEYLGVQPQTDSEGCLQDIHWSRGNFGYFPTYSLGSALAAQIFSAAEASIDSLEESIRCGEYDVLREWLQTNVHQHGCRYMTETLIEQATGESFTPEPFIQYLESKYGALYDLPAYT